MVTDARAEELPEVGPVLVDSVEDPRNCVEDLAESWPFPPATSPASPGAAPGWCWSVLSHVRPPTRR